MLKLLIAETSDGLADALAAEFSGDFEVRISLDGNAALQDLQTFQPDALILDFFLPYKDGLTLLEESAFKPRVIMGLTPYLSDYTICRATELNIQYIVRIPTTVKAVRSQLMTMINAPSHDPDLQTATLLHMLNFQTHLDGYRQLCLGIPIFADNPSLRMSKELYPAIANRLAIADPRAVEHSIRKSISHAWLRRDPTIWAQYFPAGNAPPTNKEFISRMAEHIKYITPTRE